MIELEIDDVHLCPLCGDAVRKLEAVDIVGNGAFAMLAHEDCIGSANYATTKPQAPEWDGEPLLPPVGAVILSDTTGHRDVKFRVTGYHVHEDLKGSEYLHRVFIDLVYLDDPTVTNARMLRDIRPIRTKEQREREELAKFLQQRLLKNDCTSLADSIIAAGWRKGDS